MGRSDQQSQALAINNQGVGPRRALKRLKAFLPNGTAKIEWVQQSRLNAILGSAAKSRASFVSGLRCYLEFTSAVLNVGGNEFPPSVDHLLAWMLFRSTEAFSNYLGYVRYTSKHLISKSPKSIFFGPLAAWSMYAAFRTPRMSV